MKTIFFALAVFCSSIVNAQTTVKFTTGAGCIWKTGSSSASCVVDNSFDDAIKCDVTLRTTTVQGVSVERRTIVIPAKTHDDSIKIFTARGQPFTGVQVSAMCTIK